MSPSHSKIGKEIGELVEQKQKAYGDSFGRSGNCLREMFPNGINPNQYDNVLTIARILDKLFRIATDANAFDENPWQDIAGYSILGYERHERAQRRTKQSTTAGPDNTKGTKGNTKRAKGARRSVPNKGSREGNRNSKADVYPRSRSNRTRRKNT